jgi:hypothetical protein
MISFGRTIRVGRLLLCAGAAMAAMAGGLARADDTQSGATDTSFWSRVTLEVPLVTRHIPDNDFDDQNWGAIVDVAVTPRWSVVGGDFVNSFYRNTVFAAVSYTPVSFSVGKLRIAPDVMLGLDLNGGYAGDSSVDPLLGAVQIKLAGAHLENTRYRLLDRLGLAITVIPPSLKERGSAPVNLALTYRFGG